MTRALGEECNDGGPYDWRPRDTSFDEMNQRVDEAIKVVHVITLATSARHHAEY